MTPELRRVVDVLQRLHLSDPALLLAVLGSVAAARRLGEPVWLLSAGSRGSGMSDVLQVLSSRSDFRGMRSRSRLAVDYGAPDTE